MSLSDELSKPLTMRQVEFRVQSVAKSGWATFLAYKDARVDMQRLDEVVGPLNWKREHTRDNHNCVVSIWDDDKDQWVSKEDTGTESNAESEKGLASDSFKRACFNWGIGRELYDYPLILIKLEGEEVYESQGKLRATYKLKLKEWRWEAQWGEDGRVTYLSGIDSKGKRRYEWKADGGAKAIDEVAEKCRELLANGTDQEFAVFWMKLSQIERDACYNSAPHKQKGKFKDRINQKQNNAKGAAMKAVAYIRPALGDDDAKVKEAVAEMDHHEKALMYNLLEDVEKIQLERALA